MITQKEIDMEYAKSLGYNVNIPSRDLEDEMYYAFNNEEKTKKYFESIAY